MSPLHVEVQDHIAIVTMDNPPVNAAQSEWPIQQTFDSFGDREDVRVAILTGAGTRSFCAGLDLNERAKEQAEEQQPGHFAAVHRRTRENFNAIIDCPVPVIAAVNGHALGFGIGLAASCEYVIASENATFGLPEIDVGLLGGARHFMRMFPQWVARRAHLTGLRIDAQEAYRLGAVLSVVPPEQLMDVALDEARLVAEKMPVGVRMAKANLNLIEDMDLKNGYRYEQTQTVLLMETEDSLEAKRAFQERRKPVFKGR